jgi:hypothetical protein
MVQGYQLCQVPGNLKISFWLQPVKHYVGVAWYKKTVEIPRDWSNQHVELFLERCHWETMLWVDGIRIGMQNALGAPHSYQLDKILKPGKYVLTLRIDNRIKDINPGTDAHSVTDNAIHGVFLFILFSCLHQNGCLRNAAIG